MYDPENDDDECERPEREEAPLSRYEARLFSNDFVYQMERAKKREERLGTPLETITKGESMNETQKNIISAVVKAQLKIKAPKKTGKNPQFKNSYATYDNIMDSVRVPLAEEGITVWHGATAENGREYLITRLLHVSGESLETLFPMIYEKNTSQGIASANTYAKRQGVCNILGLAGDDDDDGNEASKFKAEIIPITKAQAEMIEEYVGDDTAIADRILSTYKVKTFAELESKNFASILNGVKKVRGIKA